MSFICRKGLRIGGNEYKPGDVIPDGVVFDGRVRALKSNGYISEVGDGDEAPAVENQPDAPVSDGIEIPIKSESGDDMVMKLSQKEVVAVFGYLQMGAEECAAAVGEESRENVLIMVHAADSRKTVKSAVKSRVAELSTDNEKNAETDGSGATEASENTSEPQQ